MANAVFQFAGGPVTDTSTVESLRQSAPVDLTEQRAERRRQRTLFNMKNQLLSLKLDLDRVGTLGNDAAAVAMRTVTSAISELQQASKALQDEFYELAEYDQRQSEREQGQTQHGK